MSRDDRRNRQEAAVLVTRLTTINMVLGDLLLEAVAGMDEKAAETWVVQAVPRLRLIREHLDLTQLPNPEVVGGDD